MCGVRVALLGAVVQVQAPTPFRHLNAALSTGVVHMGNICIYTIWVVGVGADGEKGLELAEGNAATERVWGALHEDARAR